MAPSALASRAGASDSEDDLATSVRNGVQQPVSKTTNKAKATMRRASAGKAAPKRKAVPKQQDREALKDRTNLQNGSDTEEVENFDEEMAAKPKRVKTTTVTKKKAPARAASEPGEDGAQKPAVKKPKVTKQASSVDRMGVIPETQPNPEAMEDISQSIEQLDDDEAMDITRVPTPPRVQHFVQRARSTSVQQLQPRASARPASVQPGYPRPRERSGSVSGTERERRGGDPELRRKLNDMTRKYENLNLKYQNIQELGQSQSESNFEKLKRASDQKAKDADALVASLKKEIAEFKKSPASSSNKSETEGLQKQVSQLKTATEKLTADRDLLKEKLQTSQNETKSLEAKLIAARQQLSSQETSKVPGSAMKAATRNTAASATEAQKELKMKENLYSDLTGLIIRGVKRNEGEDEYDCIQTGRNGTLHFHLAVANDSGIVNPKTPTGLSYEETEFAYEPQLDESRDKDLFDLLPDYLTEELAFPRTMAVKFYTRILDGMTKKIEIEEEE